VCGLVLLLVSVRLWRGRERKVYAVGKHNGDERRGLPEGKAKEIRRRAEDRVAERRNSLKEVSHGPLSH
jgi:hypothetical protein